MAFYVCDIIIGSGQVLILEHDGTQALPLFRNSLTALAGQPVFPLDALNPLWSQLLRANFENYPRSPEGLKGLNTHQMPGLTLAVTPSFIRFPWRAF